MRYLRALFCLLILVAIPLSSSAATFNIVNDYAAGFAPGNNPNGAWSYGWSTGLNTGLNLFTRARIANWDCTASNYQVWDEPNNNYGMVPSLMHNIGDPCQNGNVDVPSGALDMHFGDGGTYDHIVFTAPTTGTYQLDVTYEGHQFNINTDVHVLANGNSLLDVLILFNRQTASYSGLVYLLAGQTIDFAVGPGTYPNLHPGHVGIEGTIELAGRVPEPGTMILLGSGLAVLLRRRRT